MPTRVSSPPDLWRLIGHDLRWRLLTVLARTDQRVGELVARVREPQNLVSYHLSLLKRASLVSERRSSADGRDVYYHLDVGHLAAELGGAAMTLHPALTLGARTSSRDAGLHHPVARVLFICTGNSARSLMAEAILRNQGGGALEAFSAGPKPAGMHPLTVEVLAELGLSARGLRSKGIEEIVHMEFDHVITLCDIAREDCPPLRGRPEYMHWSLADPAAVAGPIAKRRSAFRATRTELIERIGHLLELIDAAQVGESEFLVGGNRR